MFIFRHESGEGDAETAIMNQPWATMGVGIAVFMIGVVSYILNRRLGRKLKSLAVVRAAYSRKDFAEHLRANVSDWIIAEALRDLDVMLRVSDLKMGEFPWHPEDKLVHEFELDHEDIKDMVEAFLKQHDIPMDSIGHTIAIEDATVGKVVEFYGLCFADKNRFSASESNG